MPKLTVDSAIAFFKAELARQGALASEERQAECLAWIEAWAPDMSAALLATFIRGMARNAVEAQEGKRTWDRPTWGLKWARARREKERSVKGVAAI